ncbi:MAG: hypothetical protein GC156_09935 [Actinomycetales bacterium]|nr:hypothetical protein [Actinomycetales bacterium]
MRLPVVLLTALAVAACTPASGEALSRPASPAMSSPAASTAGASTTAASTPAAPSPAHSTSASSAPVTSPPAPSTRAPLVATPAEDVPTGVGPAPVGSYVLGDSISLSVAPALSRLGYPVTGRVGQPASTAYLQAHLASSQAQQAPAWVIILGTNNRGDEADVARIDEWLQAVKDLRTKGAKQHVYWVTPHRPDSYAGGLSDWSLDSFDAALALAASQRRWLDVLDFNAVAITHPEWFEADGGHLHPDEAGQAILVGLIAGPQATPAEHPAPITDLDKVAPPAEPTPVSSEEAYFQDFVFSND